MKPKTKKEMQRDKKSILGDIRIPISTRRGGELFKDKKKYNRKKKHRKDHGEG